MTIFKILLAASVLLQTSQVYSADNDANKYSSSAIVSMFNHENGTVNNNNYRVLQRDTLLKRENLNGDDVVPVINFPGITQADFKDAFNVLDECLVMEPRLGFKYPFIAPGGRYGACWWQLDASLALSARNGSTGAFQKMCLEDLPVFKDLMEESHYMVMIKCPIILFAAHFRSFSQPLMQY